MGAPETNTMVAFPEQRAREAIEHHDVLGFIGHIHAYLMTIIEQQPLLYDIQTDVCDRILGIFSVASLTIRKQDEKKLRELIQTVYRGMRGGIFHGTDTQQTGITILREKIVPLVQQILPADTPEKTSETPVLTEDAEIVIEPTLPPVLIPTETTNTPNNNNGEKQQRKSKYSSTNPPQIPNGFSPDWNARKWKTFCLFYGYSQETGKFDGKTHTRDQIAKMFGITIFDIAVSLSTAHRDIASWTEKPEKPPRKTREQRVKVVRERIPENRKEKPVKGKKPAPKRTHPIAHTVQLNPAKRKDEEKEEDDDDEEGQDEDEEGNENEAEDGGEITEKIHPKLRDMKDMMQNMRHLFNHPILSREEEYKLANTIQEELIGANTVIYDASMRDKIAVLMDYAPKSSQKKEWFTKLKEKIRTTQIDSVLSPETLKYIGKLAGECLLLKSDEAREKADVLLQMTENTITKKARVAIDELMKHNFKFVMSIAKKYLGYGMDIVDLFQEGAIGLQRAAIRFDPNFGTKFSTYATWWIRQFIVKAIANQSRNIRLPINLQPEIRTMQRAIGNLTHALGRPPTDEELAQDLGIEMKKLKRLKRAEKVLHTSSLDAPIGEDGETDHYEIISDGNAERPDTSVSKNDDTKMVKDMLQILTPLQRDILERRFGLNGYSPSTLEEIGEVYRVTRERIRQIEAKALRRLQNRMGHLNPFKVSSTSTSALEKASIEMFLGVFDTSGLTEQEKRILVGWSGIGQDPQRLSIIATREQIPASKADNIKIMALNKLPEKIRIAIERRGSKNHH